MHTSQIDKIIAKFAEILGQEYNYFLLKDKYTENITYSLEELGNFVNHLIEKSHRIDLTLLKNNIDKENIENFLRDVNFPILVFNRKNITDLEPIMIYEKNGSIMGHNFSTEENLNTKQLQEIVPTLYIYDRDPDIRLNGKLFFITAFPVRYVMNESFIKEKGVNKPLSPFQRLVRLLRGERRDMWTIYIYAIIVGLVNLSLPLGIQATISLISGGMIFSSVIVLIGLVILGILIGGGLQIMQITMVEVLQQRVLAKAAFEMVFRITKIRTEALMKYYPPELMNRFFDVLTIQKGLPKILVEMIGAFLQIVFGIILLSLYHPFFLIFALFLVLFIWLVFYLTWAKGLETSIYESKYKYKIAYWLEEVARTVDSFKLAGNTNLPVQKMDDYVNGYLYFRKNHYRILLTQFANAVAFKTLITGGLLIIGTILVVDRQISLGQFVASEVIIILVVGAVEKIILSLDVVYDVLTAVDKIAQVTDLPIEDTEGLHIPLNQYAKGLHLRIKDLRYKYPTNQEYTLKGLDFEIQPGESVCIAGANDSGKHTLVKILTGVLDSYEGIVAINHTSLKNINLGVLRDSLNKNLTQDEIFHGTILDNITMGRTQVTYQDVVWAVENVGLADAITALPEGLYTVVGAGAKKMSGSMTSKVILARSVVSRPKLLIASDFSEHITSKDKMQILSFLQDKNNGWTLIIVSTSDDPVILASCDKIILMKKGEIAVQGRYDDLIKSKDFQNLIFKGKE
ncbi:MAG: ATP-binding cassette domain-containing protein [Cytophagales bacterium]|nr:MAG: ATP-binding cassette domain-containing protein [Cytophagales bacterium]